MKLVTVAGPPGAGKTSALGHALALLAAEGIRPGVVKFDCLATRDRELLEARGIPTRVGLAGNLCPDHFFVVNAPDALAWADAEGLDLLVAESAGLCNRCAPHMKDVLAVCVVDHLAGVDTPAKIGPMLRLADVVVVTKGDVVSQAEREVFAHRVRKVNGAAQLLQVNGLTGQGALGLARLLREAPEVGSLVDRTLRFTMPAALCSYCLGERRLGADHQLGNVRKMRFT